MSGSPGAGVLLAAIWEWGAESHAAGPDPTRSAGSLSHLPSQRLQRGCVLASRPAAGLGSRVACTAGCALEGLSGKVWVGLVLFLAAGPQAELAWVIEVQDSQLRGSWQGCSLLPHSEGHGT